MTSTWSAAAVLTVLLLPGGMRAQGASRTVRLTAAVEREVVPAGQSPALPKVSKGTFSRDEMGRTRLDFEDTTFINDPLHHVAWYLDKQSRTGRRVVTADPKSLTELGQRVQEHSSTMASGVSTTTMIGNRVIGGYRASGRRSVLKMPGDGKKRGSEASLQRIVEVWRSEDLDLALETTTSDSVHGRTVQRLSKIDRKSPISPDLFAVPPGYTFSESPKP